MNLTKEYKKLVSHILDNGKGQDCRNGRQLIIPHYSFTLDFSDSSKEPSKLKLRKMYYSGVEGEFFTLISKTPLTNVSQFEANGCNYWKDWADENGNLVLDYYNMLHPQLEDVIEQIKVDPESRRHVIELWNHEHVQFSKACRAGKSSYTGPSYKHPMFKRWEGECQRCDNPKNKDYKNYGGRGIKVSDEFKDFYTWLGYIELLPNYNKPGYTLDRQDNNKGYERGNIIWAPISTQNINQRLKGNNTSGYTGVTLVKSTGKYQVRLMINGKRKLIGTYETAIEGAKARDAYILSNKLEHPLSLQETTKNLLKPLSLECCWHGLTFTVIDSTLHLTWVQRSVDTMVGLPADIHLAYMFMNLVALECSLSIGTCMFALSNVHIYSEHIDGAIELLNRTEDDFNKPIKFKLKA